VAEAPQQPEKGDAVAGPRASASPPMVRSRAGLAFTARAAEGVFALQHCDECGAVSYPPRDICAACWSDRLCWRPTDPNGIVIAKTTLHASTNAFFRDRLPWRIGTVRLNAGPVVVAHLHRDAREGDAVRVIARTDRSGQGVLLALPQKETENMGDDKALCELVCDPRNRRVLITDISSSLGQAMARALLKAGAAKVYGGLPEVSKSFAGREEVLSLPNTEIAPLDLTAADSADDLASSIGNEIDILINTAQRFRPGSATAQHNLADARQEVEVNFLGPLRLLQSFGPAMRARAADGANGPAAWINILSVFALSNWPTYGVSAATHAAALSLSQNIRSEFAGSGVKVVNVLHGPLDDEWHRSLPPPKLAPAAIANATMEALKQGLEQVYIGDIAEDVHARWREDPDVLERELTLLKMMD
jgi:NAD(P)-dependent dehydrogenase (short-subunit alcohol dehydrogenase family)/uncharacterized OB-fold protein